MYGQGQGAEGGEEGVCKGRGQVARREVGAHHPEGQQLQPLVLLSVQPCSDTGPAEGPAVNGTAGWAAAGRGGGADARRGLALLWGAHLAAGGSATDSP